MEVFLVSVGNSTLLQPSAQRCRVQGNALPPCSGCLTKIQFSSVNLLRKLFALGIDFDLFVCLSE